MKPLLLTFDVEEFDWPLEFGRTIPFVEQLDVTSRGLSRLLPLLERHRAPVTFFVTGAFAEARPAEVRALAAAGHEVAVHGLAHGDDYAALAPEAACERMRRAKSLVDEASGLVSTGVRTPRLRPCAAPVLRAAGFAYDASAHPTWLPGRYNGLRLPRRPWREGGLLRIPVSVMPLVRFPVSWIWYRTAGPTVGGAAARASAMWAPYLHLYFHPWEAVSLRPYGIPAGLSIRTGPAFLALLDDLLTRTRERYSATTLGAFAARVDSAGVRA